MPRLSRPMGLLVVMAGIAGGFALILIIGFSVDRAAAPARGPVLDKNGFPVPIAVIASPTAPDYQPDDTRLDVIARTLLSRPAFKTYSAVILPVSVIVTVLGLGLVWRRRLRRQAWSGGAEAPTITARVDESAFESDPAGPLLSPDELRERVEALARVIGAPTDSLPTYGRPRDFGYPHIEVDEAYHWIVTERGQELDRRTTRDLDELLYVIFQSVSFSMAMNIEVRHRRKGEDARRQLFEVQLSLLDRLRPAWAARRRAELDEVLAGNPFVDR